MCAGDLTTIGSANGLSPGRREAIIWINDVKWNLKNTLQWNVNRNSYIFIHENVPENVVCKIASVSGRPHYVNVMVTKSWHHAIVYLCTASVQREIEPSGLSGH